LIRSRLLAVALTVAAGIILAVAANASAHPSTHSTPSHVDAMLVYPEIIIEPA
jgi:hypothetical protein